MFSCGLLQTIDMKWLPPSKGILYSGVVSPDKSTHAKIKGKEEFGFRYSYSADETKQQFNTTFLLTDLKGTDVLNSIVFFSVRP